MIKVSGRLGRKLYKFTHPYNRHAGMTEKESIFRRESEQQRPRDRVSGNVLVLILLYQVLRAGLAHVVHAPDKAQPAAGDEEFLVFRGQRQEAVYDCEQAGMVARQAALEFE